MKRKGIIGVVVLLIVGLLVLASVLLGRGDEPKTDEKKEQDPIELNIDAGDFSQEDDDAENSEDSENSDATDDTNKSDMDLGEEDDTFGGAGSSTSGSGQTEGTGAKEPTVPEPSVDDGETEGDDYAEDDQETSKDDAVTDKNTNDVLKEWFNVWI